MLRCGRDSACGSEGKYFESQRVPAVRAQSRGIDRGSGKGPPKSASNKTVAGVLRTLCGLGTYLMDGRPCEGRNLIFKTTPAA